MKRVHLLVISFAAAVLLLASCGQEDDPFNLFRDPTPLPDSVAASLRTPEGNEVSLTCPPSLTDADPDKLATAMAQFNIHTPSSLDAVETLVPPEAPNSLRTLIPRESPEGPVDCCGSSTNSDFGAPFGGGGMFGFGASEEQLIQMGRLCGIFAGSGPALEMRVDLYVATPGAKEAYRREARSIYPQLDPLPIDEMVGDERTLRRSPDQYEWYILLFRRGNVIARLELSYRELSPDGRGSPEPLLQYAAQLDRNIEAAAQQQLQ